MARKLDCPAARLKSLRAFVGRVRSIEVRLLRLFQPSLTHAVPAGKSLLIFAIAKNSPWSLNARIRSPELIALSFASFTDRCSSGSAFFAFSLGSACPLS